jgi:hypothetical protein
LQIIDVKVQLRDGVSAKEYKTGSSVDSVQSFAVVQESCYFTLLDGASKVGCLNKELSTLLHQAFNGQQVRLQAFVPEKDWLQAIHTYDQKGSVIVKNVEINVYGLHERAEFVGKGLSNNELWLQCPHHGIAGVKYHNPHLYSVEGFSEDIPVEISDKADNPKIAQSNHRAPEAQAVQSDDSEVVDSILDSLSHHVSLREISVDHRIKRELLPYE